jgi:hypothetical protein
VHHLALELAYLANLFLLLNLDEQKLFISLEVFVHEAFLVARVTRFVEIVHVQLAHERREVVVLEVLREDLLGELVRFEDHEAIAFGVPVDALVVSWILKTITSINILRYQMLK